MKILLPNRTVNKLLLCLLMVFIISATSFSQSDLCGAAPLITPSTTCTPTAGTLPLAAGYTPATGLPGGCGLANDDVWYRFVARTPNPTITYTAGTLVNGRIQLLSGTCASMTSLLCGTTSIVAAGLTVGNTYYIRIYSTNIANTGTFNICVTDPIPANDDCDGAIALFGNIGSCVTTTSGNMYGASPSSTPVAPCTGPVLYDLWYYFQALTSNVTVSLPSVGLTIGTPRMQLFSGDCGGLVSMSCGTTTLNNTTLIPGNFYYVRVYGSTGILPTTQTNAAFTICANFANVPGAPANDACAGAVTLPVNTNCSKTMGTLVNATASGTTTGTCGGATTGVDVWYRFVATSANTTIDVGDLGVNYPTGANRRLQLFTGPCGSLVSGTCISGTTINSTTLVPGTAYFIRVWVTNTTPPTSSGAFSICVYNTPNAQRFGNSYVNITKQTTGGIVEPNDILEIRMTIHHSTGSIFRMRYLDSVPTNTTMVTGAAERIRVLTNEGIMLQNYTLTADADAATYIAAPPAGQYQIRMNLGFDNTLTPPSPGTPLNNLITEAASAVGQLTAGNVPNVFGSALFATAFRVRVTGAVGDTITLKAGKFVYRTTSGGPDIILTASPYKILIGAPMTLCTNSIGLNMSQEFGGTFGTGTTLNRGTDLSLPIPGYSFVQQSGLQQVGDGQYSIVKNMSPRSGTNNNAERSPNAAVPLPNQLSYAYRMHDGHWDIDGDHTGSTTSAGSPGTSDGVSEGYMLVVNADYVASETYRQALTNLCPNTYYEFSAWFRNICPTCGNDYVTGNNYTPRQPGVMPNLSFALDGVDRYNTGEIPYFSGATPLGWVKKGFVFRTGPTQTTASLSIRNNSQGGGGNDWAMDDVTVATCLPTMTYSPTINPTICAGTYLNIRDTVDSYFNNYTNYKWQRSTDNGATYSDIAGATGSATPTLVNGQWRYITNYVLQPANTAISNDGDLYRVIVATTPGNLTDPSCQSTDGISIITMNIITCGTVLKTDMLSFSGTLVNNHANLIWSVANEEPDINYQIERSTDGNNFIKVGTVAGYNNGKAVNQYTFLDPGTITTKTYYRLITVTSTNDKKYSRIIFLTQQVSNRFEISHVVNPFNQALDFDINAPSRIVIDAELLDMFGKVVKKKAYLAQSGVNILSLPDTGSLPAGTYILRVRNNDQIITKKVLKKNNL